MADDLKFDEQKILDEAIMRGLITENEYYREYHRRYVCAHGNDSFIQLLDCAIKNAISSELIDIFITLNKNLLNDRKKLEKRFKIKIAIPGEL